MAYSFSRASTQYLQTGAAIISDARNTLAALVYVTEDTPADILTVLSVGDGNSANYHIDLIISTSRELKLWTRSGIAGNTTFSSGLTVPLNTWVSVGCWAISSVSFGSSYNDVYFWVGSSTSGPETSNNRTPAGLDNTCIGKNAASANDYMEGRIAEAAFWSGAFSYDYAASLANFVRPSSVNAANLLAYWPLVDGLTDEAGENDMTAYNSPSVVAHPTMNDGGSVAPIAMHYKRLRQ